MMLIRIRTCHFLNSKLFNPDPNHLETEAIHNSKTFGKVVNEESWSLSKGSRKDRQFDNESDHALKSYNLRAMNCIQRSHCP